MVCDRFHWLPFFFLESYKHHHSQKQSTIRAGFPASDLLLPVLLRLLPLTRLSGSLFQYRGGAARRKVHFTFGLARSFPLRIPSITAQKHATHERTQAHAIKTIFPRRHLFHLVWLDEEDWLSFGSGLLDWKTFNRYEDADRTHDEAEPDNRD